MSIKIQFYNKYFEKNPQCNDIAYLGHRRKAGKAMGYDYVIVKTRRYWYKYQNTSSTLGELNLKDSEGPG